MHISLDSALGQQRRLNQVGESVTQIAPDPAAAYSLRSLTGGDPKAVRVRRSSDDAEQDFTVSEIHSGALVDYVNTSYGKYTSDFSAGDDSWGSFDDVTETGNIDGIGGLDDNLRLAIGSATSTHRAFRSNILPVNQKINFSARVFIPSTNSVVDGVRLRDASGTVIIDITTPTQDQWVTVTASNVTVVNAQLRVDLVDGSVTNFAGNGSDVIYLREVTVTQVTADGFVETWYDQSANGRDAVQATASKQPLIVESGSLNLDSFSNPTIRFEKDSETHFTTTDETLDPNLEVSAFVVQKDEQVANLNSGWVCMRRSDSSGRRSAFEIGVNLTRTKFRLIYDPGADNTNKTEKEVTVASDGLGTTSIMTGIKTSSGDLDGFFNGSSVIDTTVTDNTDLGSGYGITMGKHNNSTQFADGRLNELIFYLSDQTANRSAIETNLANHYGITLL